MITAIVVMITRKLGKYIRIITTLFMTTALRQSVGTRPEVLYNIGKY